MNKIKLLIIIIILSFTSINAQNILSGYVTNKKGMKLKNVNIFISVLKKGTVTNNKGFYEFYNLPKGIFSVQFSYVGYRTTIKKIDINKKNEALNVKMLPTNLEIGEVVVLGNSVSQPAKLPYKIEIVSKGELFNSGMLTLTRSLALLPGISLLSNGEGIAKPVIRGMFGYRIATVIDGLRFDNQQWQNEHGFGLSDVGIGKVEIIEGPASLLYGAEALGGVINLLHEKNAPVGKIIGNYNLKLLSNTLGVKSEFGIRGSGRNWSWQFHLGGESNADYIDGSGKRIPNTRFGGITAKGLLGYNSNWSVTSLEYIFSRHIYGVIEPEELYNPKENNEDHFERGFDGPHHIINFNLISFQNTFFTGNSKLKLNLGFQNNHRMEIEGNEDSNGKALKKLDIVLNTFSYNLQWIKPILNGLEWTIGTLGQFQNNKNIGERILIPNANKNEFSAFTYLKHSSDVLDIEGGIRYDYKHITTEEMGEKDSIGYMRPLALYYHIINGALGGSFGFSDKLIFKLNFATGYRAPNLAELSSNGVHEGTIRYEIGNPFMKSEKNFQIDAGFVYHTSYLKLQLSYFRNYVNNYIYLNPMNTYIKNYKVYRFMQSDAVLNGGEVSVDFRPINWIDFKGAYSTVIAKKSNDSYLPLMPADKIISQIKFRLPNWKLFRNISLTTIMQNYLKQDRITTGETITPSYTLFGLELNAGLFWRRRIVNLSLGITNLFNKYYYNALSILKPLGVHNIGRNLILSVSYPVSLK